MGRLIIDGNQVYEMDEECLRKKAQEAARQTKQTDENTTLERRQNKNSYRKQ